MKKINVRQHEPLRVPYGWKEQDRAFVIQLDRKFDELYAIISNLEERIRKLEAEEEEENV